MDSAKAKEIVEFVMREMMACDGRLRLSPEKIHSPVDRMEIKQEIRQKVSDRFDIDYDDYFLGKMNIEDFLSTAETIDNTLKIEKGGGIS